MLLSEARQRVMDMLLAVEDDSGWTAANINQKLKLAHELVVRRVAKEGGSTLDEVITTTSNTDGYCDLTSVKPILKAVHISFGTGANAFYTEIDQIHPNAGFSYSPTAATLRFLFVRLPTTPTSNSGTFLYGPGVANELLDELVCLQAARLLQTKSDERSQAIEQETQEILAELLQDDEAAGSFDIPDPSNVSWNGFKYQYLPYGIRLVRDGAGWTV